MLKTPMAIYEVFIGLFSNFYILMYLIAAVLFYIAVKKYLNTNFLFSNIVLIKFNPISDETVIEPIFNEGMLVFLKIKPFMYHPKNTFACLNGHYHFSIQNLQN
jgi:hypothetical protein